MAIDVERYYQDYGPLVLRRCRRLLGDEEAAVDAMQETFVRLIRHRDHLKGEAPSGLLYRMATNVCLNSIRAAKCRVQGADSDILEHIASMEEPEERMASRNFLSRLFSKERVSTGEIAVMHLLDGFTLEEVASRTGMSVSGVRKRLRLLRSSSVRMEQGAAR